MINLLPPDIKTSYRYAARNVSVVRWLSACIIGLVGVGILGTYGLLAVHHSIDSTDKQISTTTAQLQKAQLTRVNKQVNDISNSLKLVEKVLGQEILFSKLLKQMATAMPSGTNLTSLNISQVTSGSGLDVTAEASNYTTATQVQINLADPANQIFAKADIENVACDSKSAQDPNYPCTVTLRAQFAQNNPFLFINQKQVKS